MIVTDLSNSFNPCPKNTIKKEKKKTQIKQKSNKLAQKEKKRFSILQEDNGQCFVCQQIFKNKELDKHEAFGGSNRQKSIEWGLVYYLCRKCHQKADLDKNTRQCLHNFARKEFIKIHNEEKFLKEFGKNYLDS
ncbi:MAG TPA: hypothetical protein OIM42_04805 [Clostridiaceae bacterium]|nr:hypothetical protein [Clostridiaceae bacterium]